MKYFTLIFLLVGCGSAQAQDVPVPAPHTGGEAVSVEPAPVPPTPEEDIMPPLMSDPSGLEVLLPLALGAPAPFPGVLLNVHSVAWLEAEPDAIQHRAQLFLERRLGEVRFHLLAENERLQLRIRSMETEHQITIGSRDAQIASLNKINEELRSGPVQWWEQGLWVGGALVLGVVVGFIIGLIAQ